MPNSAPSSLRDRLIVGLDVSSRAQAEAIVAELGDAVSTYKIGYQLVFAGGLPLVTELARAGKRVFSTASCSTSPTRSRRASKASSSSARR